MAIGNKAAIFYITNKGLELAQRLKGLYPDAQVVKFKSETVSDIWNECKDLVFIMATGIVVRTIAPLMEGKKTDPAVVVLDEKGKFAISLLSGHIGGANRLAKEIANFLGGEAVITTASDVNNLPSIDLWAKENNLAIENWNLLPQISARLLNSGSLRVYIYETIPELPLPDEFIKISDPKGADILITNKKDYFHDTLQLYLRPKNLVIGIGCNSGTSADETEDAVKRTLEENKLSFSAIRSIATIDRKGNEPGLTSFAEKYSFEINTFTSDELNTVNGISKSEAACKATGANAVAEPSALLASGAEGLLVPKQKIGNVTVAVALRDNYKLSVKSDELKKQVPKIRIQKSGLNSELKTQNSKLYIIGTGPGSIKHITPHAQDAIRKSDVIIGYDTYLDLIQELIKNREVISTGMTEEIDRCRKTIELAISGKTVSLISGGDPGIYAMAGLVFEIIRAQGIEHKAQSINIEVIPGISALNACAARLGAPLMHDFASISLSDRLTPWDVIEKRLNSAAEADFVIILYNPKSKGRVEHINKASDIILKYRSPETPVGIVKAAMRENEKIAITNLKNMLDNDIDMQTTVIIGNSQTFTWDGWMVTPRGYKMCPAQD